MTSGKPYLPKPVQEYAELIGLLCNGALIERYQVNAKEYRWIVSGSDRAVNTRLMEKAIREQEVEVCGEGLFGDAKRTIVPDARAPQRAPGGVYEPKFCLTPPALRVPINPFAS